MKNNVKKRNMENQLPYVESGCVNNGKRIGIVCLVHQMGSNESNKSLKLNLLNLYFAQKNFFDFLSAETLDDSHLKNFIDKHHYVLIVFKNCVLDSHLINKTDLLKTITDASNNNNQLYNHKTNQIVGEIVNNNNNNSSSKQKAKVFVNFIHDLDDVLIQNTKKGKNHLKKSDPNLNKIVEKNLFQELRQPVLKQRKSDTFLVLMTIVGTLTIYLAVFLLIWYFFSTTRKQPQGKSFDKIN